MRAGYFTPMTAKSKQPAASRSLRRRTSKVTYPYHSLALCLDVAKAVRDIGNGKQTVSKSLLASHLGVAENSGDFAQKIASSKCYGLIDGRGDFQLTELSRAIYYPTEDPERQKRLALFEALKNPGAFDELLTRYDGARVPPQELMVNILSQEMGLPGSWANRVALIFVRALEMIGAVTDNHIRYNAELEKLQKGHGAHHKTQPHASEKKRDADRSDSDQLDDPPDDDSDTVGVVVWKYPCHGKWLRLEAPENLTLEVWEKLNLYLQVLKPKK